MSQSDWEGEGLASEGSDARGQDCIMQPFVVSKSCYETVDSSICAKDEEAILIGLETITSVVEYPGKGNRCHLPSILLSYLDIISHDTYILIMTFNAGTTSGFGCEEVMRQALYNNDLKDNSLEVICNASGLCTLTQKW